MPLELIIKFLETLFGVLARAVLSWLDKLRDGRVRRSDSVSAETPLLSRTDGRLAFLRLVGAKAPLTHLLHKSGRIHP